jgi:hypothetical protein
MFKEKKTFVSYGNHHIDENLTNEEKSIDNTDELD